MKSTAFVLLVVCVALLRARARVQEEEEIFPLAILQGPESQVVSASSDGVTFGCRIKGEFQEWIINEEYTSVPRNQRLIQSGVMFHDGVRVNGVVDSSITIPATIAFNSTQVVCVATNASLTLPGSVAVLTIAGPPLPPAPTLRVINSTALEVEWDEPFTWDEFPIQQYTVTMHNSSSDSPPQPMTVDDRSMLVTLDAETMTCIELTFEVTATNSNGESTPGTTEAGGFPVVPTDFPSAPDIEVSFTSDGTPEVEISFTPPAVCSFQTAYYTLKVFPAGSSAGPLVPLYVKEMAPIDTSLSVVEAEISTGFSANSPYYTIITFWTLNAPAISANVSFNTVFQPTAPVTTDDDDEPDGTDTKPEGSSDTSEIDKNVSALDQEGKDGQGDSNTVAIISAAVGGFVAVATLLLIVIIVIIVLLRRQLKRKSKLEREQRNTMVDNPLYEGPIYEVISENKRLKSLVPKTPLHAQESLYLDNPTQSLPRDAVPSYETNGVMIRANEAVEGKEHATPQTTTIKMEGACADDGVESNLDQRSFPTTKENHLQLCLHDTSAEDDYTIMSPAVPAATCPAIMSPTVLASTCHTNYHACSNGETFTGRYVMDMSTPYECSPQQQQQQQQQHVTLV